MIFSIIAIYSAFWDNEKLFFVNLFILHLKKNILKNYPSLYTVLEICDYTVCDVTNPKMTSIE